MTADADPARITDDGSPVYTATCAACGAATKYRRPAPLVAATAPPGVPDAALADVVADESAAGRADRLPDVVLDAAWWVRFTLRAFWAVVFASAFAAAVMAGASLMAYRAAVNQSRP